VRRVGKSRQGGQRDDRGDRKEKEMEGGMQQEELVKGR